MGNSFQVKPLEIDYKQAIKTAEIEAEILMKSDKFLDIPIKPHNIKPHNINLTLINSNLHGGGFYSNNILEFLQNIEYSHAKSKDNSLELEFTSDNNLFNTDKTAQYKAKGTFTVVCYVKILANIFNKDTKNKKYIMRINRLSQDTPDTQIIDYYDNLNILEETIIYNFIKKYNADKLMLPTTTNNII
jgi:hypothetical protein